MDGGWVTLMHEVNKLIRCIMTSYYNQENIKNTKTEPTIYMIILTIVATIIIMITKTIIFMVNAQFCAQCTKRQVHT